MDLVEGTAPIVVCFKESGSDEALSAKVLIFLGSGGCYMMRDLLKVLSIVT